MYVHCKGSNKNSTQLNKAGYQAVPCTCCFFQVNTFQCILATSERESFVMFLYADLQWTTGDSSLGSEGLGGIEALAGYNAGDGIDSFTINGSRSSSILNLTRTSNVGIPGTWIFKVGQG